MSDESIQIQRGEKPAHTIPQLVDGVRQNLAGAGADCGTVRSCIERGDTEGALNALTRLYNHLLGINHKTTLAFGAAEAEYSRDCIPDAGLDCKEPLS